MKKHSTARKQESPLLKTTAFLLTISWIACWFVLGLYILTFVAVPLVTSMKGGTPLFVNALPVHFQVSPLASDPNVEIFTDATATTFDIPEADGVISFESSDLRLHALASAGIGLSAFVILFILFQLRKIVAKVRENTPFIQENLKRIRSIAYAIFAYQFLNGLHEFISASTVQTQFYLNLTMPEVTVKPIWNFFNLNALIFVLIILVIEYSFRAGLVLQEEKDLTI